MKISLILLTLAFILGCKDTGENDKPDKPRETRGALMERIEREKGRVNTEQVGNPNPLRARAVF